jgi:hypothetical protein
MPKRTAATVTGHALLACRNNSHIFGHIILVSHYNPFYLRGH